MGEHYHWGGRWQSQSPRLDYHEPHLSFRRDLVYLLAVTTVTVAWAREADAYPTRATGEIRGIVVHRIEVSQEDAGFADSARDIERFFVEHPIGRAATGGRMPYPILVEPDGNVTQTVPLARVTPHAKRHNASTIGVACVGDFRVRAPTAEQRQALVRTCAQLLARFGLATTALVGHDELAGASSDPEKECPGAGLVMAELRRDVANAADPGSFEFVC